jgi:hypothetical protein
MHIDFKGTVGADEKNAVKVNAFSHYHSLLPSLYKS